jgi:hypothetical protein
MHLGVLCIYDVDVALVLQVTKVVALESPATKLKKKKKKKKSRSLKNAKVVNIICLDGSNVQS